MLVAVPATDRGSHPWRQARHRSCPIGGRSNTLTRKGSRSSSSSSSWPNRRRFSPQGRPGCVRQRRDPGANSAPLGYHDRPAGRPIDAAQRGRDDRAGVVDVPDIADALVTSPQQLLIHGKKPGTISLFVWDKAAASRRYEVTVRRDLSALGDQLRALFPGERIGVHAAARTSSSPAPSRANTSSRRRQRSRPATSRRQDDVVNLLKQQEGVASNQVLLRVRFAEVSRSALQELGASFFTGPGGFQRLRVARHDVTVPVGELRRDDPRLDPGPARDWAAAATM